MAGNFRWLKISDKIESVLRIKFSDTGNLRDPVHARMCNGLPCLSPQRVSCACIRVNKKRVPRGVFLAWRMAWLLMPHSVWSPW